MEENNRVTHIKKGKPDPPVYRENLSQEEKLEFNFLGDFHSYYTRRAYNNTIEEVVVEEGVEVIGGGYGSGAFGTGFSDCIALKRVTLPTTLKKISPHTFAGCTALETIVLPEGLEEIGSCAFWACSSLKEVILPASIKKMEDSVFWGCTSLCSVVLPDTLNEIPINAFSSCASLEAIKIPQNVTTIPEDAFNRCIQLSSVILPNGLEVIGEDAFWGCSSLRRIDLPDTLRTIENGAFNFSGLTEIHLPASVSSVGTDALSSKLLMDIYVDSPETTFGSQMAIPDDARLHPNGFAFPKRLKENKLPLLIGSILICLFNGGFIPIVLGAYYYFYRKSYRYSSPSWGTFKRYITDVFLRRISDRLQRINT